MKKILLIFLVLCWSCTKMEIEPTPQPIQKIFSVKESRVVDGQSIHFDLPSNGVYTLTLIDKETGQVVGREKFTGVKILRRFIRIPYNFNIYICY